MAFIPIILVFAALIGYFAWKSHQRTVAVWLDAAAELGLGATAVRGMSRPELSGHIDGHPNQARYLRAALRQ